MKNTWYVYVTHTLINDSILVCHFGDICIRCNTEVTWSLDKQENRLKNKEDKAVVTFSLHLNNNEVKQVHQHHLRCTVIVLVSNRLHFYNVTGWLQLSREQSHKLNQAHLGVKSDSSADLPSTFFLVVEIHLKCMFELNSKKNNMHNFWI